MTISCSCGAVTGFEADTNTKEVECIRCGALLDASAGKILESPPEQPMEETDLLRIE